MPVVSREADAPGMRPQAPIARHEPREPRIETQAPALMSPFCTFCLWGRCLIYADDVTAALDPSLVSQVVIAES